jgi:hypothetical protein
MGNLKVANLVREIGALAPKVAKEHAEQQAAFEAERAADTKLLESVINMAKPALAAISSPLAGQMDGMKGRGLVVWAGDDRDGRPLKVLLADDGSLWECSEFFDPDEPLGWCSRISKKPVRYIAETYDVANIIASIHTALVKQAGKRKNSTEKAREGAGKLNAILTLLDAAPNDGGPPPSFNDAGSHEGIPF